MKKILLMLLINCSFIFAQSKWEVVFNEPYHNLYYIEIFNKIIVSAAGNDGFFIISKDTGKTWQEVYLGTNALLLDISYVDEANIWICGYKGTIVKYDSKENKYYDYAIDSKHNLKSICFIDNLKGLSGSDKGFVFMTNNGGKSWDTILYTGGMEIKKIKMKTNKDGYILCGPERGGKDSRLYKTIDGGITWKIVVDIKDEYASNILLNKEDIWLIGKDGLIIKSSDGGSTWEWLKKNFSEHIWSMVFNNDDIYIAAGWHNFGICKSSLKAQSFELDLDSQGTTMFRLTGNGEYLFTEISDGRIDGIHEILRKKIR